MAVTPQRNCYRRAMHHDAEPDLALYIHWPFCISKCPYCDFNSHVRDTVDQDAWRDALLTDLAHEASLLGGRRLGSIFFGGGTPSLMPPSTVAALIEAAARHWTLAETVEITLEANPSSVEASRFADLAVAGVNRLSLGIQSFDDHALHLLGRAHDAQEALAALDIAQACFARTSFDLIYALPGQSPEDWSAMLARALALGTGHLSLYQLTIEAGTRFETEVREGRLVPQDADSAADLFDLTQELTAAAGLPAYETSNHARAGDESRHNLTYWRYGDYAGIGPGAHGRRQALATVRHKKPENWMNAVIRNRNGLQVEEALSPAERAREALVMGLRLSEGIRPARIARRCGVAEAQLFDPRGLAMLMAQGLIGRDDERLWVTPAGRLLLDAILAELVAI